MWTRSGSARRRLCTMGNRVWLALVAVLALTGCKGIRGVRVDAGQPLILTPAEAHRLQTEGAKLYTEQPRTVERVARAAQMLESSARALRTDYDAQIATARALAFLAENESEPEARQVAAKRGIVIARHAREVQGDRVEGHYWYAVNVGLLADVDRAYGLDAVGEMERALKRAIELDEKYDFAGPLRLLAILHLRTPAPPASIGSPRKGLRLLQKAVELFPDYPENYLYLAEALRDTGKPVEAKTALEKIINAPPWPDRQAEARQWKAAAGKLSATLASP